MRFGKSTVTAGQIQEQSPAQSALRQFADTFCSNFQKNRLTDFQNCRISLSWAALESSDPRASNGGSNVEIWPNAADLITVETSRLTRNWDWNQQKSWQKTFYFVNSAFSNVMRSAPKSQRPTFGPPLDVSGSELSSADRIIATWQTCEVVAPHFWKRDEMFEFWAKCVHKVHKSFRSTDCTADVSHCLLDCWQVKFVDVLLQTNIRRGVADVASKV